MEHAWTQSEETVLGTIEIAPEVVELIASLAVVEIEGIRAMSGSFVGDLTEKIGRKNLRKGVRVDVNEEGIAVDVSVIVHYGTSIPDVARELQYSVQEAIEAMTSLPVKHVRVFVTGVDVPK